MGFRYKYGRSYLDIWLFVELDVGSNDKIIIFNTRRIKAINILISALELFIQGA